MKICIYAISYNNEDFVDTWYTSVNRADELHVLDIGSTDNTITRLKEYGVDVIQEKYSLHEIYKAKNKLLDTLKGFKGLFLNIDVWESISYMNWVQIQIENFKSSYSLPYIFKARINDFPSNKVYFENRGNTSCTNVYWKYPYRAELHNLSKNTIKDEELQVIINRNIDIEPKDNILLRLYEDKFEEDIRGNFYFIEEALSTNKNKEIAMDTLDKILISPDVKLRDYLYAWKIKAEYSGNEYLYTIYSLLKIFPYYRDFYIILINYYIQQHYLKDAYKLYISCKENSERMLDYLEDTRYWEPDFMEKFKKTII